MTIVVVPRDRHHDRPHKEGNNMPGPCHFLPTLLMNRMGRVGMGGATKDLTVHY